MPIIPGPLYGCGHERVPGKRDCPPCARDRALQNYYANRETKNAERNEKRRGTYQPKPKRDENGNLVCRRGHLKEKTGTCQECRREWFADRFQGKCVKGHPKESGKNCKQCAADYMVVWRAEHKQEQKAKSLANYYRRVEEGLVECSTPKVRAWKQANPERAKAIARISEHRRRTRKAGNLGRHTNDEWLLVCERQKHMCAACGLKCELTEDHIVPVSMGGNDYIFNIQGLCGPCNSRKHARITAETQYSIFDKVKETLNHG